MLSEMRWGGDLAQPRRGGAGPTRVMTVIPGVLLAPPKAVPLSAASEEAFSAAPATGNSLIEVAAEAVVRAYRSSVGAFWRGKPGSACSDRRIPIKTMSSYAPRTHACSRKRPSTTNPAFW